MSLQHRRHTILLHRDTPDLAVEHRQRVFVAVRERVVSPTEEIFEPGEQPLHFFL